MAYSKFIKPKYAIILNISKDHLDWHGSMKNYINSKLKIFFSLQTNDNFAFINNKEILKKYKKMKYSGKLIWLRETITIKSKKILKIII